MFLFLSQVVHQNTFFTHVQHHTVSETWRETSEKQKAQIQPIILPTNTTKAEEKMEMKKFLMLTILIFIVALCSFQYLSSLFVNWKAKKLRCTTTHHGNDDDNYSYDCSSTSTSSCYYYDDDGDGDGDGDGEEYEAYDEKNYSSILSDAVTTREVKNDDDDENFTEELTKEKNTTSISDSDTVKFEILQTQTETDELNELNEKQEENRMHEKKKQKQEQAKPSWNLNGFPKHLLWKYLVTQPKRFTCDLQWRKFGIQTRKTTHDKFRGQCSPSHTVFDEKTQSIRMKCVDESHIPFVYNSSVFNARKFDPRFWTVFPVEKYRRSEPLEMASDIGVIHTACVDMVKQSSYHSFITRVTRNQELVRERQRAMERYWNETRNLSLAQGTNQVEVEESNETNSENNKDQRPIDIHVIVLDCVGRDFFNRHFPHTKQYLKQLQDDEDDRKNNSNDFSVLELENYQVLG